MEEKCSNPLRKTMIYHNEQKEKCKRAEMNTKGFCKYGWFDGQACVCSRNKLNIYCPFAWKIREQNTKVR